MTEDWLLAKWWKTWNVSSHNKQFCFLNWQRKCQLITCWLNGADIGNNLDLSGRELNNKGGWSLALDNVTFERMCYNKYVDFPTHALLVFIWLHLFVPLSADWTQNDLRWIKYDLKRLSHCCDSSSNSKLILCRWLEPQCCVTDALKV